MAPTLYSYLPSPPVRAVLMTAKAIGVPLREQHVDILNGEHLKPEFIKLNPQHTVPTLVDEDGFTVWDSHAITTYLISKYAQDDSLYPKDLKKRAIINQRLYFEAGAVFPVVAQIVRSIIWEGKICVDWNQRKRVEKIYNFLEIWLEDSHWIAGNFLTVADFSVFSSVSTLNCLLSVGNEGFDNVKAWLRAMDSLDVAEINRRGLELMTKIFQENQ